MAIPAIYTPPYQQTAADGSALIPQVGQAIGQYLIGSTAPGGIISAPQVFAPTAAGYRAKRFFATANPQTGTLSWFRNVGRPILFSGDLTACKRVNKVAARARRASPRRRAAPKRRR